MSFGPEIALKQQNGPVSVTNDAVPGNAAAGFILSFN
jgi:hypothetical protein